MIILFLLCIFPLTLGKCFEGEIYPVNQLEQWNGYSCYDLKGNEYKPDQTILSCCGCIKLTCTASQVPSNSYGMWTSFWKESKEATCCKDCHGTVFSIGSVISSTLLKDNCSTTVTKHCVFQSRGNDSFTKISENYKSKSCCYDSTDVHPLGRAILDPKTCSSRQCSLPQGSLYGAWISSTKKCPGLGCDCCVHGGELVCDGGHITLPNGVHATCCSGMLMKPQNPDEDISRATAATTITTTTTTSTTTTATYGSATTIPGGIIDGTCYEDDWSRLLDAPRTESATNTPEECKKICAGRGYDYAGVQYTIQCFCGNDEPPASRIRDSSECDAICPGDAAFMCGGSLRMNIYKTDHAACAFGYTSLEFGCYQFIETEEAKTFEQARNKCNETGGYLAEIFSKDEQDAFVQFAEDSGFSRWNVWLGATRGNNGKWIWAHSKQEMNFKAWFPGEPNNQGGNENCLAAWGMDTRDMLWNDLTCEPKFNIPDLALCQYSETKDACPSGWTSLETGCYQIIETENFEQAKTGCTNAGGFLVEINSQSEQDALWKFYGDSGLSGWLWLGATDQQQEDNWIWIHSGQKMSFTAWDRAEPDGVRRENCLVAVGSFQFRWADVLCDSKVEKALCEYSG